MPTIVSRESLAECVGKELGVSDWMTIDQDRIDRFADATLDHQFIHVDPERAKAETPYGGTIAHGYLTLALIPHLIDGIRLAPEGVKMVLNYGMDRLRFMEPVRTGNRIRAHLKVLEISERSPRQILVKSEVAMEIEGNAKPALVAELLAMYLF